MKDRYKEILEGLSEDTAPKDKNDRILIIDGLNTFIRSFAVNPSVNEDGIVDLLEYALGLSPDASDSPAISGQNSGGYILFSHPKRAGTAHGLTYTVQTNGNLKFGDWEDHSTVNSSESPVVAPV